MTDDPRLAVLGQFTPEGVLTPGYGDHYLFFVGQDDVHGVIKYLIDNEHRGFKFNQFGYDDEDTDASILKKIEDEHVFVQGTLDRSQAGGVHEKKILAAGQAKLGPSWGNSFVIGQSKTHQISHTKGGVLVGQGIAYEGSTNWSASGEGIGIDLHSDADHQPTGFKAQNNTLMVSSNPVLIARFGLRLDIEHAYALQQSAARAAHPAGKAKTS